MNSVGTKFVALVGIVIGVFSGFFFYRTYSIANRHLTWQVEQQVNLALKFNIAIRDYVADKVRPVMYKLVGEEGFIPETMSTSFVARAIFAEVNKDFPDFILKFSSSNPRNPANLAGPEEKRIIDYFNRHPEKESWTGRLVINGRTYLARFQARRMEASCLRCHGDPADAPSSLLARYGDKAAFHRPLGEVIALDTVALPVDTITSRLWGAMSRDLLLLGGGMLLLFLALLAVFKFLVTDRLGVIARHFVDTAGQQEYLHITPVVVRGNDEIAALAASFNILAGKLQDFYSSLDAEATEHALANKQLRMEMTEREKAEAAQRKWERIFQNASWGVAVSNADATATLQVMNPAYADMHGRTEAELVGTPLADLFAPAWHERIAESLAVAHDKGHCTFEAEHLRADGTVFPVAVDISEVKGTDGTPLYRVVNAQEITERKRLEEQLMHAQKMEAVGKLAGGVAHDFNNILTTIMGYSEMLSLTMAQDDPMRERVEAIHNAGKKAAALTNQLLAFSRKQVLSLQVVNLHSIVLDMGKMFTRLLGEDIELSLRSRSTSTRVKADPVQLEQILMNLAVNSRDAMPRGGSLVIETDTVTLGESRSPEFGELEPGSYVRLTVSDTGEGMPPEVMERIFEPFFTTKKKGKGTGLGLATAYGIIRQHGGHVHVYSEVGRGSTFRIYFPAVDQPLESERTVLRKALPVGQETVLVVEDEAAIRRFIDDTLSPLGYHVLAAANGREALDLSRGYVGRIDLLLTDVVMPEMNGIELAEAHRRLRPDTRVLLMSGYTEEIIAKHGGITQDTNFLRKPLLPSVLAEKLREVLDG